MRRIPGLLRFVLGLRPGLDLWSTTRAKPEDPSIFDLGHHHDYIGSAQGEALLAG